VKMNYLEHFGLKSDPFRISPDPEYYFSLEQHEVALKSLNYSIVQNEGFCLIVGEPGTGKTLVLRILLRQWYEKAKIAYILSPTLNPLEFLKAILDEFGLSFNGNSKHDLLKCLRDYLMKCFKEGEKVMIIVDEAQQVPDETLEEIRLLSNFETENEKLLNIILVGQRQLMERLQSENFQQLYQRITVKAELGPLSEQEMREYMLFRLSKAGRYNLPFEGKALGTIYEYSGGIPRLINVISSRAMMAAFLDGRTQVKRKHVSIAAEDLKLRGFKASNNRKKLLGLVVIMALLGVFGMYHFGFLGNVEIGKWKRLNQRVEMEKEDKAFKEKQSQKVLVKKPYTALKLEPMNNALELEFVKEGVEFHLLEKLWRDGKDWCKVRKEGGGDYWLACEDVIIGRWE